MNIKTTLPVIFAIIAIQSASAQDIIYRNDGTSEKVKLRQISVREVTYKRWNNLEGPDFVMPRREIKSIRFENGTEEKFGRDDMLHPVKKIRTRPKIDYGKNILAFSPVFMTNTSPIGIAASYERILGEKAKFSFYVPLGFSFDNPSTRRDKTSTMLWAYPGVKYYPTGNNGIGRFAVGPSLVVGAGHDRYGEMAFDEQTQTSRYREVDDNVFLMGFMVNASLNLQPTAKVYMGLELGLGMPYLLNDGLLDDNNSNYATFSTGEPLTQFQIKIGYRY